MTLPLAIRDQDVEQDLVDVDALLRTAPAADPIGRLIRLSHERRRQAQGRGERERGGPKICAEHVRSSFSREIGEQEVSQPSQEGNSRWEPTEFRPCRTVRRSVLLGGQVLQVLAASSCGAAASAFDARTARRTRRPPPSGGAPPRGGSGRRRRSPGAPAWPRSGRAPPGPPSGRGRPGTAGSRCRRSARGRARRRVRTIPSSRQRAASLTMGSTMRSAIRPGSGSLTLGCRPSRL